MNALSCRVNTTKTKLVTNQPITSEICYFKGTLNDQFSDVLRTHQDELQMKLKIIIINEDMAKYKKISYPNIAYNKENERLPLAELDLKIHIDSNEDEILEVSGLLANGKHQQPGCTCFPEKISGEDIDLSIDLLLDNSENLGEHRFDVPNMPEDLIHDQEFREKYYEDFYHRLLTIFEEFCDYQIRSQKYKIEDIIFVKLICKDQLFVIKISTFESFYKKSKKYIKLGKSVFIKATYYQINNVMIGLSYNENKSILHDLNPNYALTHEWTKEYFDLDKNMQIDYSDFDLDYYLDEDDDEWLNLEKSLESIIKNFQTYLNARHEILFAEICVKQIRDNDQPVTKDFRKIRRSSYCCSFKINITDLILLALELKRFPPCVTSIEEIKHVDFEDKTVMNQKPDKDNTLNRFKSERLPNQGGNSGLHFMTSPPSNLDNPDGFGLNRKDSINYDILAQEFSDILNKDYKLDLPSKYFFCSSEENKTKKHKSVEEDPLIFYTVEVVYAEKSSSKRKFIVDYGSIFDRSLIKDYICSAAYIKEQTRNKLVVNKSDGYIDPGIGASISEWMGVNNESIDNCSFDINKIEDEEE